MQRQHVQTAAVAMHVYVTDCHWVAADMYTVAVDLSAVYCLTAQLVVIAVHGNYKFITSTCEVPSCQCLHYWLNQHVSDAHLDTQCMQADPACGRYRRCLLRLLWGFQAASRGCRIQVSQHTAIPVWGGDLLL